MLSTDLVGTGGLGTLFGSVSIQTSNSKEPLQVNGYYVRFLEDGV